MKTFFDATNVQVNTDKLLLSSNTNSGVSIFFISFLSILGSRLSGVYVLARLKGERNQVESLVFWLLRLCLQGGARNCRFFIVTGRGLA